MTAKTHSSGISSYRSCIKLNVFAFVKCYTNLMNSVKGPFQFDIVRLIMFTLSYIMKV